MSEIREKMQENKYSSKANALEECVLEQNKHKKLNEISTLEKAKNSIYNIFSKKNIVKLQLSNLDEIYATQIDFYNKRSKKTGNVKEKEFYKNHSNIFTIFLYQYEEIVKMEKEVVININEFAKDKIIDGDKKTELIKKIEDNNHKLGKQIEKYINIFNKNACGDDDNKKEIKKELKTLIFSFSKYKETFVKIESDIITNGFNYIKKHPIQFQDRKDVINYINSAYSRRMKSGLDNIMILSDLINIQSIDISESEKLTYDHLPRIDIKVITAQRNKKMEMIQKSAKTMNNTFAIFSELANPSIWSKQGIKKMGRENHDKIQEATMPKWVNSLTTWAEGETEVPEYFEKFGKSESFLKYQESILELSDYNSTIYIALKNPTEKNREYIDKFLTNLKKNESEYLKKFSILTSSLSKKGADSKLLEDIIDLVNNNLFEIIGGITTVGLWAIGKTLGMVGMRTVSSILGAMIPTEMGNPDDLNPNDFDPNWYENSLK